MSKKAKTEKLSKSDKAMIAAWDREREQIRQEVSGFYPNGDLADFSFASGTNPFQELLASEQETLSQERMMEECERIRAYVQAKKPDNIEIRFNEGSHYFNGAKHPLATTVVKLRAMDSGKPIYLYMRDGDTIDAMVFIGGDDIRAFLATKDTDGKEQFVRLSEVHLLSYHENEDRMKETGLLTSFVWPGVKIYSSVLFCYSLSPLKNLLLSEWLQDQWKRIKDAAEQSATEMEGGADHGEET